MSHARAYYNENNKKTAAWLRELIAQNLIAPGNVDERSIEDIQPQDLAGYTQCHFFAGIGGWSLALRLAGWPDDCPVWTGSCPCQPFSTAGQQKGKRDKRHLWPSFLDQISFGQPPVVFGEQVASALGRKWLSGVFADLAVLDYASAGSDLPAACVGAPHIRQRLFWVALAHRVKFQGFPSAGQQTLRQQHAGPDRLGDPAQLGRDAERSTDPAALGRERQARITSPECDRLAVPHFNGSSAGLSGSTQWEERIAKVLEHCRRGSGFWDSFELIACADEKARRVEPGTFPLAHGFPCRVDLLRGYGNAINPFVAAEFIRAFLATQIR